jgi:YVTN family beta-propeller protein
VIDTTTNTVTATIELGQVEADHVVFSPDGSRAYVTTTNDGVDFATAQPNGQNGAAIVVIDTATNTVTDTIPVNQEPLDKRGLYGLAVSPDGATLYVANGVFIGQAGDGFLSVIDLATGSVTANIPVGIYPVGVTLSPDGSVAYVDDEKTKTVSVIDLSTNTVTATISGYNPSDVALSPDGSRAYIVNVKSNTVSVFDTATNTEIGTFPSGFGGGNPSAVVISPDGSTAYVSDASGVVSLINLSTNSIITNVTIGVSAYLLAVSPDGSHLYVLNSFSGITTVIKLA